MASALAAGRGEFRVAPDHFAERHGLIVIIALGKSIIAVGVTAARIGLAGTQALTVGLAVALIAALWWAYFDWFQAVAEGALGAARDLHDLGHVARDLFTFAHFPLVAGIVTFAAGLEEAVQHPAEHLEPFGLTAVAGGIGAVLIAFSIAHRRPTRHLPAERAVAAGVVAGLAWGIGARVAAPTFLAIVAAVLAGALMLEGARRRAGRARLSTGATSR
ncbi:MAG: low temperature requirement protein A [Acidimicrobiia bacterium]|nr:low temperature requirement protein A [Acidimicrobiia bacterium]